MAGHWIENPLPDQFDPEAAPKRHVLVLIDHSRRVSVYACGRSFDHPGDQPITIPTQVSAVIEYRTEEQMKNAIKLCQDCLCPGVNRGFF